MAISPDELRKKTFSVVPKGYDRPEVNKYLGEIATELQKFNAEAAGEEWTEPEVAESTQTAEMDLVVNRPAEATPREPKITSADEFDRVGAEISIMLRQAQESAVKIRGDAEAEARQLIDQVRVDIEADRVAHERAAGELISRTEERATSIRLAAEDYGRELRASAEEFAQNRKETVDAELKDSEAEAVATRQATAEQIETANIEASTIVSAAAAQSSEMVEQAQAQSSEMVEQAQAQSSEMVEQAQAESDRVLSEANASLQGLLEAQDRTRHDLAATREVIDAALDQSSIADLEGGIADDHSAEDQAS